MFVLPISIKRSEVGRSYQGQTKFTKSQAKVWFTTDDTHHFFIVACTGEANTVSGKEFLAAKEAYKAIFWHSQSSAVRTFDSPGLSAERSWISVCTIPHSEVPYMYYQSGKEKVDQYWCLHTSGKIWPCSTKSFLATVQHTHTYVHAYTHTHTHTHTHMCTHKSLQR